MGGEDDLQGIQFLVLVSEHLCEVLRQGINGYLWSLSGTQFPHL